MGSSDDEQRSNEDDFTSSPNHQQHKKRKFRGSTTLPEIIKAKSSGVKKVIEYNEVGQPIGVNRAKYASYLGVLARTLVPISILDWFKVTPELKAKLWSSVEVAFDVDERTKKKVLSSIAEKWRTFKGALSRHIRNNSSNLKLLSKPPEKYSFIEQKDWDSFLKHRLSKEFKIESKDQRDRQSFNKYPCRLSRKGYSGLEEELKKDKYRATEKFDRSYMWKKARQNKKGEYDDEDMAKQAAKIDEVAKQVDEGVLVAQGSDDILTKVLGKEHSSRVRGVGQFVSPSTYFHVPRRKNHSQCEERVQSLEAMVCEMKVQLDAYRGQTLDAPRYEHMSSNTFKSDDIGSPLLDPIVMETGARMKDDLPLPNPDPKLKNGKQCKLAVGSIEFIVAHGTMYETVSSDKSTHMLPLRDSSVRVTVDYVIVSHAHLPIPVPGSMTLVGEALGYQVAWPKNLVLFGNEGMPKHLPKQANEVKTNDDFPHPNPNPIQRKTKKCKLSVESIDNIVAHGSMFEKVSNEETVHMVPLGELNMRVSVDFVIIPNALLPVPVPIADLTSVGEAVGCLVAWPKNLILVDDEGAPKHLPRQVNERVSKHLSLSGDEAPSKNIDSDNYLDTIELFAAFVTLMNNEESTFILEKGIFGVEIEFSLAKEDMEEIYQFKELSISCVMFYISYLYAAISEANLDTSYLFVNPSIISGKFKPSSSKATLLSSRLQEAKTGQLVFVPYNYEYHWMLAVIDLSSAVIYYFDSLHNKVNVSLQLIIETALRIYDIDKGNRRSSAWELVECPKQPSGKECGFYVMRYMKDVITNPSILSKRNFGGKKMYTNIEIDEARVQWINCFLTKLQSA